MKKKIVLISSSSKEIAPVKAVFEARGFKTTSFLGLKEALKSKEIHQRCILILGTEMKKSTLAETIKAVRKENHQSPLVFISTRQAPEIVIEGLKSGASDYLYGTLLQKKNQFRIEMIWLKYKLSQTKNFIY